MFCGGFEIINGKDDNKVPTYLYIYQPTYLCLRKEKNIGFQDNITK